MVRTRSASSELTRGRPTRPRCDFQVQKARKPCRCQRITVSGRTTWSASRHRAHWWESHTQKRRSRRPNCGRFGRRRRRTRFSSARSVRVLSDGRSAPNRSSTRDIALPGSRAAGQSSSLCDRILANDSSRTSRSSALMPRTVSSRVKPSQRGRSNSWRALTSPLQKLIDFHAYQLLGEGWLELNDSTLSLFHWFFFVESAGNQRPGSRTNNAEDKPND